VNAAWWANHANWKPQLWKAAPDDVIGGSCVMLLSESRTPAEGAVPIAEFLTEDVARHVAYAHNLWVYRRGLE